MTRRKADLRDVADDQAAPAPDLLQAQDHAATADLAPAVNTVEPDTDTDTGDTDLVLDPYDPARLRIDPATLATAGAKRILSAMPVAKPGKQDFFRVNPAPDYRCVTSLIVLKDDRDEAYLIAPDLQKELAAEGVVVELVLTITRQNVLRLWPLRYPDPEGRDNPWHVSARKAAALAETAWIRMVANQAAGSYDIFEAIGDLPAPKWPDEPFIELLKLGFPGRMIDTRDHAVLQRLSGKI